MKRPAEQAADPQSPRPLGLLQSVLFFGPPGVALILLLHAVMAALIRVGVQPFYAHSLALLGLFVGLVVAALVGYVMEGRPLEWPSLAARFRLKRLDRRDWPWTIVGFRAALLG